MSRRQPRPFRPAVVRHYTDATCKTRCRSSDPGAVPRKERLDTFYAKLGGKKVSLETTDEGQAWERLRALLKRRAEGRAGLRDGYTDHAERPLGEHVDAWCDFLAAKGTTANHVADLRRNVLRVAAEAGWGSVVEITAESCLLAADRLAAREGHHAQTRKHILSNCKQFSRWLSRHERLRSHPLDLITFRPVEDDLCHERRCPTDGEMARLWAYLCGPGARRRQGMTGPRRALGYRVAMAAGLRAGELRSLTRESFDLAAGTVTVEAAYDKRRRKVTFHLPPWLLAELREWFAAGGGCWGGFPAKNPGKVLYADLHAAAVPVSVPGPDGKPRFFDFHSLRVWYCTRLAEQPDMDLKTLMDLCRHKDPRLTLKIYNKGSQVRREAAAARLAEPGQPTQTAPVAAPPVGPTTETTGSSVTKADETSTPERARPKRERGRQKPRGGDAKC
jgi:integrase